MVPALSVVVSLAVGVVTQTNIGFILGGTGTGVDQVIAACPRALEAGAVGSLAGASACSDVRRVLQLPNFNRTQFSPTAAAGLSDANTYFDTSVAQLLPTTAAAPLDWVSGPPNFFTGVDLTQPGNVDFATGFFKQLALRVQNAASTAGQTFGLVLPPVAASATSALCTVAAAAQASGRLGWSWQAASVALSTTLADEATTTFGYRTVAAMCPALIGLPAFADLTAAGGWFPAFPVRSNASVVSWVQFVDGQVRSGTNPGDAEVRAGGVLLRTLGGGGTDDISPASAELTAFLQNPSAPPGSTGGTSTGGASGGSPPGGTGGGPLSPTSGHSGCGNAADGLALLSLAALAPIVLRRRRGR
jgi:hypothetical protein